MRRAIRSLTFAAAARSGPGHHRMPRVARTAMLGRIQLPRLPHRCCNVQAAWGVHGRQVDPRNARNATLGLGRL